MDNEDSVWHYYRELIERRRDRNVLVYDDYDLLLPGNPDIYAYLRTLREERVLVVLSFGDRTPTFSLNPDVDYGDADCLVSNYAVDGQKPDSFELRPFEARVYELD